MIDAATLNEVVNDPSVAPYVAPGHSNLDLSEFLGDSANIAYGDHKGAVIFNKLESNAMEMHYLLTNQVRGAAALQFIRQAIGHVFTTTNVAAIVGAVPRANLRARIISRAVGLVAIGSCIDLGGRSCVIYKLDRELWAGLYRC